MHSQARTTLKINFIETPDGVKLRLENDVPNGWAISGDMCPTLDLAICSLRDKIANSHVADDRTKQLFASQGND